MTQPLPAALDLDLIRADLDKAAAGIHGPAPDHYSAGLALTAARVLLAELEQVRAAIVLEPCHTTGLHTPDHHPRWTCDMQKEAIVDRLLEALRLSEDKIPRRLHPDTCTWCHGDVPGDALGRERLRASYRWAGIEVPAALAEEGPR